VGADAHADEPKGKTTELVREARAWMMDAETMMPADHGPMGGGVSINPIQ